MLLKACTQKGMEGVKACDIVLASHISISILIMGRLIPPFSGEREEVSILGCVCLPFQTNWLTSVCSWVIMEWGGGDRCMVPEQRENVCIKHKHSSSEGQISIGDGCSFVFGLLE